MNANHLEFLSMTIAQYANSAIINIARSKFDNLSDMRCPPVSALTFTWLHRGECNGDTGRYADYQADDYAEYEPMHSCPLDVLGGGECSTLNYGRATHDD